MDNKYWIKNGDIVIHRDLIPRCLLDDGTCDTDILNKMKLRVEDIVYDTVCGKKRIKGIKCHWIDTDMKLWEHIFHTNELLPYDVVIGGQESIDTWINSL
jgi:hypothetical protein